MNDGGLYFGFNGILRCYRHCTQGLRDTLDAPVLLVNVTTSNLVGLTIHSL
jgi:hypothetical protein